MEQMQLILTIGFCLIGVGFSGVYIWLNTFSGYKDLKERSSSLLKWNTTCMILPVVVDFVSCLLTDPREFNTMFDTVAKHYSFIAIVWVIVAFMCAATLIIVVLSKKKYAFVKGDAIAVLFRRSLIFSLFMFLLSWLFR